MRVLFWSGAFLPQIGGIGVLAAQLLPALRGRGYEFIVVAPKSHSDLPDKAQYQGIPVYRFPFWNSLVNIDELMEVKQQVVKLKRIFTPDLVHINAAGRDDFFHLTTANAYPAPLLVTLHGEWVLQANAIVGSVLRSADWVVGCSKAILDKGRQLVPAIIPRSGVIYNAVEAPSLLAEPLPTAPRLLCLGRISQEKGFDLALTAFASIVKQFPHARLVMAGDGPERATLAKQAAEMGLKDTVDFVGWVAPENVPALINTATMVVMPSRFESLPVVALQAAQMARAVVGTRVGGLPEVVLHQQTGLLVEKEDSQALAQAIVFLLEHPETATQLGQAAREQAQKEFNWQRHVDAYAALYRKLITDWRGCSSIHNGNRHRIGC
jgi:glycogen(starch) synthase